MTQRDGSPSQTENVPTIAEMINTGMASVSALVASYTKAALKVKELTSPTDRQIEDQANSR